MNRTLIIYASKYGSTEAIAQKLALILGPAAVITPSGFQERYRDFQSVVIGSPVYNEEILGEIRDFIQREADWLKTKKVALFTVSLSPTADRCYSALRELLGECVVWQATFGGVYDPAAVDDKDARAMERFSQITGFPNTYQDLTDDVSFSESALGLKRLLKNTLSMPQGVFHAHIEEFLLSHNTCTLCTGHGDDVRATPIEYMYLDRSLYLFTEGGEKFAHVLVNPQVSVAVYEEYTGFQKLAGLQITGTAALIGEDSEEFNRAVSKKGLNPAKLMTLPAALHLLKVSIQTCELLSSKLSKEGYDVRQASAFE